jgi:hypothetical protein
MKGSEGLIPEKKRYMWIMSGEDRPLYVPMPALPLKGEGRWRPHPKGEAYWMERAGLSYGPGIGREMRDYVRASFGSAAPTPWALAKTLKNLCSLKMGPKEFERFVGEVGRCVDEMKESGELAETGYVSSIIAFRDRLLSARRPGPPEVSRSQR